MPSIHQVLSWAQEKVRKGLGDQHTNHIVIIEEEARKRAKNPADDQGNRKTKIAWDSGDPEMYAAWHKERERWMVLAKKNPTDCTAAMIIGLRLFSNEQILDIISNLQRVGEPHEPS